MVPWRAQEAAVKKEAAEEMEELQLYIASLQKDLAARKNAAAAPPIRVADASVVAPWTKKSWAGLVMGDWRCSS